MRAVILAAGEGSRLRASAGGPPKPLFPVCGLTLLERAARCARAAGCEEIVVVTGYEGERVRARLAPRLGPGVRWVHAPEWRRGNGASLLAAAGRLRGAPFLLLMADHVLDPEVLRRATAAAAERRSELDSGAALLLVDARLQEVHDLAEATRVRREGEVVTAIGKGLEPFDAVDAGVFVGGDGLLDALEEAARAADGGDARAGGDALTLTAAAARLAARGRLLAVPLERGWWVDVDDAAAARAARERLLAQATASGGDGPVARHLNRPLSRLVTRVLSGTRATPDAVTAAAFVLMLLAAAAFAAGHPALGGLLAQAASVVDGVDGELARLRLSQRPAGAFLDTVLDRYADAALVMGLAAGALREAQGAAAWVYAPGAAVVVWTALAALAGMPLSALMKDRLRLLSGADRRYNPLADDPAWLRWIPANRDGRCLVVCILGLLGAPWAALAALALLTHALALGRLVWGYRTLDAHD
ncbi:MAG: NTP transferase domain-containing protein [Firmicutes bacterium]|nr:NTP transferase domain-containing protein [Bacillota bacterium]